MKTSIPILILFFVASISAMESADLLERFRWDYRIILISAPAKDLEAIEKKLNAEKAAIHERHILWFIVVDGQLHTNFNEPLPKDIPATIQSSFFPKVGEGIGICLIGKDGGVKARQKQLDINKLFALIDSMPMRQAEMKNN
jgi:hypothetical protein